MILLRKLPTRRTGSYFGCPRFRGLVGFLLVCLVVCMNGCSRTPRSERSSANGGAGLSVGDLAPPIRVSEIVWGESIGEAEASGVQVIEFWATWCGPCRVGMPHLSEIQESYGDEVTIVGITDEAIATVEDFLRSPTADGLSWGEVIKYRLAIDDRGATSAAYMKASGQAGIPTAFIIGRDGILEWIGHPMEMDGPLRAIVDGDWDREKT